MGTDTEFGRPAVQIEGQAQCPIHRSGTLNVQRSTLNFQLGDRKGAWWAGYGDRHRIWAAELLTRWTWPNTGRTVQAGGVPRYGDRHGAWGPAVQIEGQAQCPIHQSGTFNAQRSTPNFQLGDRKGAWCAGYGDRHSVWGPTVQIEGQARCPIRRSEMLNVQRSSLNLQRDDRKGRVVGGIWGQTRNLGDRRCK